MCPEFVSLNTLHSSTRGVGTGWGPRWRRRGWRWWWFKIFRAGGSQKVSVNDHIEPSEQWNHCCCWSLPLQSPCPLLSECIQIPAWRAPVAWILALDAAVLCWMVGVVLVSFWPRLELPYSCRCSTQLFQTLWHREQHWILQGGKERAEWIKDNKSKYSCIVNIRRTKKSFAAWWIFLLIILLVHFANDASLLWLCWDFACIFFYHIVAFPALREILMNITAAAPVAMLLKM